nr:hypothetical transcript [Hymenolepis microstoma]
MLTFHKAFRTLLATHLRRRRNEADNQSSTLALEDRCSPDQRALLHVNNDMVTNTESSPEIWGGHETTSELAQTSVFLSLNKTEGGLSGLDMLPQLGRSRA